MILKNLRLILSNCCVCRNKVKGPHKGSFFIYRTQVTKKRAILIKEDLAMAVIMIFIMGVLLGVGLMILKNHILTIGSLRIDTSIPDDEPYLFLELDKELSRIGNKKCVVLKVNKNDYLPHENMAFNET